MLETIYNPSFSPSYFEIRTNQEIQKNFQIITQKNYIIQDSSKANNVDSIMGFAGILSGAFDSTKSIKEMRKDKILK